MLKSAAGKVKWLGRATVFLVGLAVILALVFGVATTALAGTGVGAVFNLGKTNTVDAISKLVGTTTNSTLMVDNNGAGTALDLRVGSPTTPAAEKVVVPMKVDSQAEVANLNAQFAGHADTADSAGSAQSAAGLECTGCVDESDLAASAAIQAELNNEAAIRQSADTTLQNNINQETAARQNADNALGLDDCSVYLPGQLRPLIGAPKGCNLPLNTTPQTTLATSTPAP